MSDAPSAAPTIVGAERVSRKLTVFAAVAICLAIGTAGAVAAVPSRAASSRSSGASAAANYAPLPKAELHEITSVSAKTFAAVGVGKPHGHRNHAPGLVKSEKLVEHGKPELAYIIAEFCPYCAAESWSVAVALSRFGKFRGLTTLVSSASDDPASLQTISFRYSHFDSRYLGYDPIVNEDVNRKHVESVPPKVHRAWTKFGPAGFPFIDFGGVAVLNLASFEPTVLRDLSRKQIAGDLSHPSRLVAEAIDGSANEITATICLMTKEKPGTVCRSTAITAIRRALRPLQRSESASRRVLLGREGYLRP